MKIVASNEMDEHVIHSVRSEGGRVDIYGVGTKLATAAGEGGGALGGVYKLVRYAGAPRLKITSDLAKATLPDSKRLLRVIHGNGGFAMDVMTLSDEILAPGDVVFDPVNPLRHKAIPAGTRFEEVRLVVMEGGRSRFPSPSLQEAAEHCQNQLHRLPDGSLRLINPHIYKVSMSRGVHELRSRLIADLEASFGPT